MGFFGNLFGSKRAKRLANNANHSSVEAGVLENKKLSGDSSYNYLNEEPLIEHLYQEEQPHFILSLTNITGSGVFVDAGEDLLSNNKFMTNVVITDQRILFVVGGEQGDRATSVSYDDVSSLGLIKSSYGRHTTYELTVGAKKVDYRIRRFASADIDEDIENTEDIFSRVNEYIARMSEESIQQADMSVGSIDTPTQQTNISVESTGKSTQQTGIQQPELREELKSIRSQFRQVDSLVMNAEFQQAEQLLNEIESNVSSLKQQMDRKEFDAFGTEIQQFEKKCSNYLSKSNTLNRLREIDPYEFEELVAKIWRKRGWNAEVTSGSADRGVDVVATKDDAFEKRRHLIQAKRYGENTVVGSEDIQRYAGLYARRDEKPDAVFIVTSSRFTNEATEVAKNRDVRTVDCYELYEMLTETGSMSADNLEKDSVNTSSSQSVMEDIEDHNSLGDLDISYNSNGDYQATSKREMTHEEHVGIISTDARLYLEEDTFGILDYYIVQDDSVMMCVELTSAHEFNVVGLSDDELRIAKSFFEQSRFELLSEDLAENGNYISAGYDEHKRVSSEQLASDVEELINRTYNLHLSSIVAIERRASDHRIWEWTDR